jgi:hypothetical protein
MTQPLHAEMWEISKLLAGHKTNLALNKIIADILVVILHGW